MLDSPCCRAVEALRQGGGTPSPPTRRKAVWAVLLTICRRSSWQWRRCRRSGGPGTAARVGGCGHAGTRGAVVGTSAGATCQARNCAASSARVVASNLHCHAAHECAKGTRQGRRCEGQAAGCGSHPHGSLAAGKSPCGTVPAGTAGAQQTRRGAQRDHGTGQEKAHFTLRPMYLMMNSRSRKEPPAAGYGGPGATQSRRRGCHAQDQRGAAAAAAGIMPRCAARRRDLPLAVSRHLYGVSSGLTM